MPKYYEDKEEDNRACSGVREDFRACLLQHDCVVKEFLVQTELETPDADLRSHHAASEEGKLPSQCLKEGNCKALQTAFFECKRSMLDTRSRFRGRKGF